MKKRIFYDVTTKEVILDVQYQSEDLPPVERNVEQYKALSERNRDTFDVIELPYGAYASDFAIASGYRVNPETKELEFQYPDPNEPEIEQPYITPLSEQISEQMDYLVDVDFRLSMMELGI